MSRKLNPSAGSSTLTRNRLQSFDSGTLADTFSPDAHLSHMWDLCGEIVRSSVLSWGPFSTANVLISVCNSKLSALNNHCSANGHVSLINSNSSRIAYFLGDIEYFICVMKKTLWAPPSLFAIANSDLSFASVRRTFAANSRSVEQTEQTFNKTFVVFAVLNGPLVYDLQTLAQIGKMFDHMTRELFWVVNCKNLSDFFMFLVRDWHFHAYMVTANSDLLEYKRASCKFTV